MITISLLADKGMLVRVRGGATALGENFTSFEHNAEEMLNMFAKEKTAIAQYAATLIGDGDFVYLDAGTTTEKMINFKSTAIMRSKEVYILGDHSKFGKITASKFAELKEGQIITDKVTDKKYLSETSVKEAL